MRNDWYTAHAANLGSMRSALRQISNDALKKLRNCVIKRMTGSYPRFRLNDSRDDFVFYDSKGNRILASAAFSDVYIAGYRRALSDVRQDISTELELRATWEQ